MKTRYCLNSAGIFVLIGALVLAGSQAWAQQDANRGADVLDIGYPAPRLDALQWIKGEPVTEFRKGRVYVVEFWANWCIGCIEAMPKLSALARQYERSVTFISVHTETARKPETNLAPYLKSIRKFVEKKGMDLHGAVAIDDPVRSPIFEKWLKPAGVTGIPRAFIVDGAGEIAWIGDPRQIDQPLAQVLDGSLDRTVFKAQRAAELAQRQNDEFSKTWAQLATPVQEALERKNFAAALAQADESLAAKPTRWAGTDFLMRWRLEALLNVDEKRGLAYSRELLDTGKLPDHPRAPSGGYGPWQQVGSAIVMQDGLSRQAYQFALECLAQEVKKYPNGLFGWQALAVAHTRLGEFDAAERAVQRVIVIADKLGMSGQTAAVEMRERLAKISRR